MMARSLAGKKFQVQKQWPQWMLCAQCSINDWAFGTPFIRMQEGLSFGVWQLNGSAIEMSMSRKLSWILVMQRKVRVPYPLRHPATISKRLRCNLWIKHSELLPPIFLWWHLCAKSPPTQTGGERRMAWNGPSHQLLAIEGNSDLQSFKASITSMKEYMSLVQAACESICRVKVRKQE